MSDTECNGYDCCPLQPEVNRLRQQVEALKRRNADCEEGNKNMHEGVEQAAKRMQAAEQQVEALQAAIQAVLDGNARATLKYEQCRHGKYGYEDCENCIDDFLGKALEPPQQEGE